jgi:hypothetical protein
VNLVRIEQGVEAHDEPYEKLDSEISPDELEPLRSTFMPLERDAILDAARGIVSFFRERAPIVAVAHGLTYPAELDRLMGARLERLRDAPR